MRKNRFPKFIIAVLVLFLIYNFIIMFTPDIKSEIAVSGTMEKTFSLNGIIIRDEVVMKSDTPGVLESKVKENEMVKMLSHKGQVFAIEPPLFAELEVTETEPGFKGDTAQGATKPATLETGAQIKVPLFIDIGNVLRIDTRTGEYLSRV